MASWPVISSEVAKLTWCSRLWIVKDTDLVTSQNERIFFVDIQKGIGLIPRAANNASDRLMVQWNNNKKW